MLNIVRAQGQPQPLLGEVRQVDRQMAPEGAVVIPDMMVLVARVAADRQFRLFVHRCVLSFWERTHQEGLETKKPSAARDGIKIPGRTFFGNQRGSAHLPAALAAGKAP